MSAVVVAFEAYKPSPQRPWQNHELAELYRAVDILRKAGLAIETDMGVSDEGDPWFAFCRTDNGEVIVHCARINGLFVANSIAIDQTFKGSNFREVIDSIVRYEPLKMPLSTAGARLTLHPIMVLAAFVATALLFAQKADAHDLHATIVSLNGGHDAAGGKGSAGLKAVVGGFLQSLGGPSGAVKPFGQSAQAADAEAPAALAALMAAAMSLVSTVAQNFGIEEVLPSAGAIVMPAETQISNLVLSDPASTLLTAIDRPTSTAAVVEDSTYQAWVGALVAGGGIGAEPKPLVTAAPIVAHDGPSVDLSAVPPPDSGHAAASAAVSEHFIFPLQHVPTSSAASVAPAEVTTAATPAPSASPPAFDMSEVSPVAMAVLLGQGTLPAGDPLTILENELHPKGGNGGGVPGGNGGAGNLAIEGGPATPVHNVTQTSPAAGNPPDDPNPQAHAHDQGQPSTPPIVVVPPPTPSLQLVEPQAPANAPNPADQPPEFIWLVGNPTAGMSQIMSYAESYHPLLDTPTLSPAADLMTAINDVYSSGVSQPKVIVFDSNAINLQFFEFAPGVLMVSDHELGYTPSPNALAMATIVELASGAQMRILGVLDAHPGF